MKITAIEDLHADGGWRTLSFLKITTDEGLVGWSEFQEGPATPGLAAVIRKMAQGVLGEDPRCINAIRARFNGVAGGWVCGDPSRVRGFEVCIPDAAKRAPLYVVNAFVDRAAGSDIIVVFNREMDPDTRIG